MGVIHLIRLLNFILIIFVILNSISSFSLAVEENENNIEATLSIVYINGTNFNVDVNIKIKKITTDRIFYENEINFVSEQDLGAFRFKLYEMLKNQINVLFKDAYLSNFSMPVFSNGFFNETFEVELNNNFFDLNESVNTNNLVNGVLDMGALINYSFNLKTEDGWNNTYNLFLSNDMDYKRTTGTVDGQKITWQVNNWNGEKPNKTAVISVKLKSPTTPVLIDEDIRLEFIIDTKTIDNNSLKANIMLFATDIIDYNIIPGFIQDLDIINSDGLRLLIDNNFTSLNSVYNKTIKAIEEKTISSIEKSSLNNTLNTIFKWDNSTTINCKKPYDIEQMDNQPPLTASIIDDNLELKIFEIPSRVFFGLLNSGAMANITPKDINFGDGLERIGLKYNGSLILPQHIFLENKNVYEWDNKTNISGKIFSEKSPNYQEEKINTTFSIDTRGLDLNLIGFFTGEMKLTLSLYAVETINYNIFSIPEQFTLPKKLSIDFIDSDSTRLCIEEKVFPEKNVTDFLDDRKQVFENRFGNILEWNEIEGSSDNDEFKTSLEWDKNISNMDSEKPVIVSSYAYVSYPVSFDISFIPPSINIHTKKFNFTGLQNQNITYSMIFPRGLNIRVNDTLNKASLKQTAEGREYLELSFNASENPQIDTVFVKMTPSVLFLIGIFMPCMISLIITILLVILIYILRKKRNRKKNFPSSDMESDYQEQNYYVPPPPQSK